MLKRCGVASSRELKDLVAKRIRRASQVVGGEHLHPHRVVRAHDCALAAVDADVGVPDRDLLGQSPLLVSRGAGWEGSVHRERTHRKQVTLAGEDARGHPGHEVRRPGRDHLTQGSGRGDDRGHRELVQLGEGSVDGGEIALDDLTPPSAVGLLHCEPDGVDGLFLRQDP